VTLGGSFASFGRPGGSTKPCGTVKLAGYCFLYVLTQRISPATWFMAVICAAEPTRDTEMPTDMAGRTP
jgi:hypothetical protein